MNDIDRRHVLFASAGLTGIVLAGSAMGAPLMGSINLTDPKVALDAYVKLRGSTADETVFQPYEGDIFLVADGQVGIPLCGFKGLQKSVWRRDGQGGFTNKDYDLGFYVDYQTREILDSWNNPLTGKTVKVYHYRGGPSGGHFTVGSGGGDVYSDAKGRWAMFGDQIWHSSANWGARANPMMPEEWPLASAGKTVFGSMSTSFAGRVSDIANPDIHNAPSYQIWTNTSAWMPWMEMGQRPGFNSWHWIGAKGASPAGLSPSLAAAVETVWPGYIAGDSAWTEPTSGRVDYMRAVKGLPLTR